MAKAARRRSGFVPKEAAIPAAGANRLYADVTLPAADAVGRLRVTVNLAESPLAGSSVATW